MTINYNKEIMTSHPWTFFLLLFKWKGSIWKAVYFETIIFLICYGILSVMYRVVMGADSQRIFESVVRYFDKRMSYIPLEFVLGFFVTTVVSRWTKLYQTIGFIDNVGLMANLYIRGNCEKSRIYRRNVIRYCELIQVLVFRDMSMRARRRFPSLETVVAGGFMSEEELQLYRSYDTENNKESKYWIPANWALSMTYMARKDGFIESDYFKTQMEQEIRTWRTNIEWVCNYDWVPLNIGYPQVVCLAVHLYFFVAMISRQMIIEKHEIEVEVDVYFPVMTFLQFIFYMGWLKVMEVMVNPFGEDDDDFETNALIDRNITMGLMIADNPMTTPDLRKDPFFDDADIPLLYSEESSHVASNPFHGSVSNVRVGKIHQDTVRMMSHSQSEANIRRIMSVKSVDSDDVKNVFSISYDESQRSKWKRDVKLNRSFLRRDDDTKNDKNDNEITKY